MRSVFALLPAAGHSSRMGKPKLSLPFGERTVIEHVVGALRDSGIEKILVVVGPHVADLVPLAKAGGASVLLLEEVTANMRGTVEAGLKWIEKHWQPADQDAFLLAPADHAVLDGDVIRELTNDRSDSILIPTFQGRRGHPTLIGWRHVALIRKLPTNIGMNEYFRSHPEAVREIPVASESILLDLDTPADYERLLAARGVAAHSTW